MKAKIGLIGYGKIGKEVEKRALQRGWAVPVIIEISGVYNSSMKQKIAEPSEWLDYFRKENVDIAVLCIPTLDDGTTAYNYIKTSVGNEIPIVTSEKGAWGNYGPEL
ncbi:hypothetical protein MUP06_02530, partial [Patescibacteria group bacterium]|nr:hypothetical protein [Patescibacteria group bacterium]